MTEVRNLFPWARWRKICIACACGKVTLLHLAHMISMICKLYHRSERTVRATAMNWGFLDDRSRDRGKRCTPHAKKSSATIEWSISLGDLSLEQALNWLVMPRFWYFSMILFLSIIINYRWKEKWSSILFLPFSLFLLTLPSNSIGVLVRGREVTICNRWFKFYQSICSDPEFAEAGPNRSLNMHFAIGKEHRASAENGYILSQYVASSI